MIPAREEAFPPESLCLSYGNLFNGKRYFIPVLRKNANLTANLFAYLCNALILSSLKGRFQNLFLNHPFGI